MLVSVISAAVIVRQRLATVIVQVEDIEQRIRALDNRIDANTTQLDVLAQRQGVISAMLDPANMERRAREAERLITEVEHLKRQRGS
jgi:tetrahydromethanopterin S-methyltransferase subunit B